MKTRFAQPESEFYSGIWWCIQRELSSITLQIIIRSLFAALKTPDSVLDGTPQTRALVKKEATFAYNLCSLSSDPQEVWDTVSAVVLGQNWNESYSRLFVCWLAMCETNLHAGVVFDIVKFRYLTGCQCSLCF